MYKSMKQIADSLGIDKQRVYRYIKKNHINEALRSASTLLYDEAVEAAIKLEITSNSNEITSNEVLQNSENETIKLFQTESEALQKQLVKQYESQLETQKNTMEMLKEQLSIKDKQIEALQNALENTSKALSAAQSLHAGTLQQQLEHDHSMDTDPSETAVKEPEKETYTVEHSQKATLGQRIRYLFRGK